MIERAIVGRTRKGDQVWRQLECGHEQLETPGGRSKTAYGAHCKHCGDAAPRRLRDLPPAPVDATCTAILVPLGEQRMRLCGKAAKVINRRGQPRCVRCARRAPKP